MDYKIRIDEKKMIRILHLFSKAIGVPMLFYAYEPRKWIMSNKRNRPFCHILERNQLTNKLCCLCDEKTHQRCQSSENAFSYFCHAGLLEIICPVYYESVYAGFLVTGQFRMRQRKADIDYIRYLGSICNMETEVLLKKYKSHAVLSADAVEGIQLLEMLCAEHMIKSGVFWLEQREIIAKVEKYIQAHIDQRLTLEELASHIYMTPSYLSHLYKEVTGEKLSSYIQKQRIETACCLIRTTKFPFSEIARKTGFCDGNYFTKVFRKELLMTPSEYRRKWETGELVMAD